VTGAKGRRREVSNERRISMLNRRILLGATALFALGILALAAACTQEKTPSKEAAAKGANPEMIVQAGQLQPAPAAAQPSGWDTPESIRGGLRVVATYDSDGPAAWDPVAHPLVYYTSEGRGYDHRPSKTDKLPGIQLIDAYTKQVFAAPQYDLGYAKYSDPHQVAASPDGKWLYTYTNEGDTGEVGTHRLIIINAKTLKVHMILTTITPTNARQRFHHIKAFKDSQGRDRVLVENQNPNGPKFILDPNDNNRVVRTITMEDVGSGFGHPNSSIGPDGKTLFIALRMPGDWGDRINGAIAKFDLEKGTVKYVTGVGIHPNGMAHTSDGKFTYVNDSSGSRVYKIDNAKNELVGSTQAGVSGPYSLTLNWDETELWTVGKGEGGSHNTGGVLGVIDTKTFTPTNKIDQPVAIGGSIMDHDLLHPDPKVNEMWISSAGTWETIVVDLNTYKVKARIPSPHGGDTHSGAFVRYNPDFNCEVMVDQGGPLASVRKIQKENAAKLVAAVP
jgi:DNA-binding beta-propeller fold protein YncE